MLQLRLVLGLHHLLLLIQEAVVGGQGLDCGHQSCHLVVVLDRRKLTAETETSFMRSPLERSVVQRGVYDVGAAADLLLVIFLQLLLLGVVLLVRASVRVVDFRWRLEGHVRMRQRLHFGRE